MGNAITQYYRCPERYAQLSPRHPLSTSKGYFRFGDDTVCYGSCFRTAPTSSPKENLYDASFDTVVQDGTTLLPFDLEQVVNNLRCEVYTHNGGHGGFPKPSLVNRTYYLVRPLLPIAVRRHLQKIHLNGWHHATFPRWPVDRSVENLFEQVLLCALRASKAKRIPFIWFWPEGAPSCAVMTHDVETTRGRDFCQTLMDINDAFKIKASFQVVPEKRYEVPDEYLDSITGRGFEVGVQDLNHDGHLYRNREQFLRRAAKINWYGHRWGSEGFRAAVLYRRQEWFDALQFSFDMSVPNVAHLDPQRGGCCTVMPYFIGKMLELPVTTTQDYPLFHILKDYSIDLWKRQAGLIMEKHGLMSFIIHPDYITGSRERAVYEQLLAFLAGLRVEKKVWIAMPSEVNHWWRQRAEMQIIERPDGVRIEGPGSERARVAFASEENGRLEFSFQSGAN